MDLPLTESKHLGLSSCCLLSPQWGIPASLLPQSSLHPIALHIVSYALEATGNLIFILESLIPVIPRPFPSITFNNYLSVSCNTRSRFGTTVISFFPTLSAWNLAPPLRPPDACVCAKSSSSTRTTYDQVCFVTLLCSFKLSTHNSHKSNGAQIWIGLYPLPERTQQSAVEVPEWLERTHFFIYSLFVHDSLLCSIWNQIF